MTARWPKIDTLQRFLATGGPDPANQLQRIRWMERNIGLPVKAFIVLMLFYYLFFSHWLDDVRVRGDFVPDIPPREGLWEVVQRFFLVYVVVNTAVASLLLGMRHLPLGWIQKIVFTSAWFDALFLATLTFVTGGFDSFLYWVFLGLIVRNAVSTANAPRQLALNLFATACYILSGVFDVVSDRWQYDLFDDKMIPAVDGLMGDAVAEPFLLRVALLLLMTVCCVGVQALFDRQRTAEAEAREFALRQEQLQATGRLAAEIAHQLKNPLGIINNAAFTLQRTVKEGKTITQQIQIIREEVDKSDRIITELMGYAKLTEGRVERLIVTEELDAAIQQVFPEGAKYETKIIREYAPALPALLLQRAHLSEVIVNILQNAREAMNGKGAITVSAQFGENYSIVISIADTGPGIPPAQLTNIFEPYFTTKERGTGLGLAIVKHNTEIYGGTVEVESELGQGTRFIIRLPAKTLVKIRK